MILPPDLKWPRRVAWGFTGLSWLFWLSLEDQGLAAVLGVSLLIAAASGITMLSRWLGSTAQSTTSTLTRFGLTGLASGLAVGPVASVLIAVKVGLHAHPVADYSVEDVIEVLNRFPVWAVAGLLSGLAAGLLTIGLAYNGSKSR